jgi:phosphoglycolate phosphatase
MYTYTMTYQAVLFDLDGTLLNTLQAIADSANTALRKAGFATHSFDDYRYFVGEGMRTLALKALPENARDHDTAEKVMKLIDDEYSLHWMDNTSIYDGIPELLDGLAAQHIKMAVFSNKPQKYTAASVEKFLARWNFNVVLGASENIPHKPDPAGALLIAKKFGILPERFVYLGDTSLDMRTAVASGMYPVGALWGFRPEAEILSGGAKKLISEPCELMQFFSPLS